MEMKRVGRWILFLSKLMVDFEDVGMIKLRCWNDVGKLRCWKDSATFFLVNLWHFAKRKNPPCSGQPSGYD
jgi:hypothetical protein